MKTGRIYRWDVCKGRFIMRVGIIPFMYASHNAPHTPLSPVVNVYIHRYLFTFRTLCTIYRGQYDTLNGLLFAHFISSILE